MDYVSIDKDTIKRVEETVIDLRVLRERLVWINTEIAELEAQPDDMVMPNVLKIEGLESLNKEKQDIAMKLRIK